MKKNFYKLYDLELGCIGKYSTKQKAASAEKRFLKDTDGDGTTWIVKKESVCGMSGKNIKSIDKDNW